MGETVRVAIDAFGGDNAPKEIVKGAVKALTESANVEVQLVGDEEKIREELSALSYDENRVKVIRAPEVIGMAEPPVMAVRTKKESSLVKAMYRVKNGEADAFVSAGSTGAILVGGQVIIGRIKGIDRAPLAPFIPTEQGMSLLIDCGANVDARANHLVQFAQIGSIYMEKAYGKANPKVGIVNIGAEEEKGNALVKEAFPLLKNCPDINFIGSVEARDIPAGVADVIVCEAFTGNVILKMYEGVSASLMRILKDAMTSSFSAKLGAALVKGPIKEAMKPLDSELVGGAPMLGLNGLVVKTHGSAKEEGVKNAILQCVVFHEQNIGDLIRARLSDDTAR